MLEDHADLMTGLSGNRDAVHDKDKRFVRSNPTTSGLSAVTECCGDNQLAPPSRLHAHDAQVPTLDDLAGSQREAEGLGGP